METTQVQLLRCKDLCDRNVITVNMNLSTVCFAQVYDTINHFNVPGESHIPYVDIKCNLLY